ncbi:Hypothetical predicted protein [Pelobates cultripes]|uniref:Uncharacterized protein n=1 Tax=Pelobates cultripes TaxID=61616 RepID=A0AAD1RHI8_PELCU|nr:Hypothetical predicted protein [Pelobates cultripes]
MVHQCHSAAPVRRRQHRPNHRPNHRVYPMHPGTLVIGDGFSWICAQLWRICGQQSKGSMKGWRTFERWLQTLRQDAQEVRRQEAEIARQQMATFNQAFLGVLGQLVQVLGGSLDPRSPPRQ